MKTGDAVKLLILAALTLAAGCAQSGLRLKDAHDLELQVGSKEEYSFVVENLAREEYKDILVEFVDEKWLVRTISAKIDKPALKSGESATIKLALEGAKVGENKNAKLRIIHASGGEEFDLPLSVKKDPNSNLTFKLSSLSPLELLAFNKMCG